MRGTSWHQGDWHRGEGEEWIDFKFSWEVKSMKLVNGLNMGGKGEGRTKKTLDVGLGN